MTKKMGTSCEHLSTCMIISLWFLFRMRNVTDKSCRENQNIRFMFSNFFFQKLCCLWDIVEKYGYSQTSHRWQYNMAQAICMLDN